MDGQYKLRIPNVSVFTNLETKLNSRTTKEQAMKEAERLCDGRIPFEDYEWKIEGCDEGGILEFGDELKQAIIERIEEDPEESVDWDGMAAGYEINVFHIPVRTTVELALETRAGREEALREVERLAKEENLFEGRSWKIAGCDEGGINEFNDALKNAILEKITDQEIRDRCIEEVSG